MQAILQGSTLVCRVRTHMYRPKIRDSNTTHDRFIQQNYGKQLRTSPKHQNLVENGKHTKLNSVIDTDDLVDDFKGLGAVGSENEQTARSFRF